MKMRILVLLLGSANCIHLNDNKPDVYWSAMVEDTNNLLLPDELVKPQETLSVVDSKDKTNPNQKTSQRSTIKIPNNKSTNDMLNDLHDLQNVVSTAINVSDQTKLNNKKQVNRQNDVESNQPIEYKKQMIQEKDQKISAIPNPTAPITADVKNKQRNDVTSAFTYPKTQKPAALVEDSKITAIPNPTAPITPDVKNKQRNDVTSAFTYPKTQQSVVLLEDSKVTAIPNPTAPITADVTTKERNDISSAFSYPKTQRPAAFNQDSKIIAIPNPTAPITGDATSKERNDVTSAFSYPKVQIPSTLSQDQNKSVHSYDENHHKKNSSDDKREVKNGWITMPSNGGIAQATNQTRHYKVSKKAILTKQEPERAIQKFVEKKTKGKASQWQQKTLKLAGFEFKIYRRGENPIDTLIFAFIIAVLAILVITAAIAIWQYMKMQDPIVKRSNEKRGGIKKQREGDQESMMNETK